MFKRLNFSFPNYDLSFVFPLFEHGVFILYNISSVYYTKMLTLQHSYLLIIFNNLTGWSEINKKVDVISFCNRRNRTLHRYDK
jgi:hypothetical protein